MAHTTVEKRRWNGRLIQRLRNCSLCHAAAGFHDLAEHAVLHPFHVPPFHRIDRRSVDEHGEVQMVARGEPRHPASSNDLSLVHLVANLHTDGRQVTVERLHTETMVDDYAVAVDPKVS